MESFELSQSTEDLINDIYKEDGDNGDDYDDGADTEAKVIMFLLLFSINIILWFFFEKFHQIPTSSNPTRNFQQTILIQWRK